MSAEPSQALQHTPIEFLRQQQEAAELLAEIKRRKTQGSPTPTDEPVLSLLPRPVESPTTQWTGEGTLVELIHRDFTLKLRVLDVTIGELQAALVMPATTHVDDLRIKSRFTLRYEGQTHEVMYLGGQFNFQRVNPVLRVLSFMRIADRVPKP